MKNSIYLIFGWLSLGLGFIGIFLPILPTVPFLLLAAYLFEKGSLRTFQWILNHPNFGPPIQDWRKNGIIRTRAKIIAVTFITLSLSYPVYFHDTLPIYARVLFAIIGISVSIFILSRPHEVLKLESKTGIDSRIIKSN